MKVLVIERNAALVRAWNRLLSDLGCVEFAESLQEAREKIQETRYSIFLCGGELPEARDGKARIEYTITFLKELFASSASRPVVFITASWPENQTMMMEVGCQAIVDKSKVGDMLRELIETAKDINKK